jgi:hypothetical protein
LTLAASEPSFSGMRPTSFTQIYSSKTDDELLALAAARESLVEEAHSVLASEMQRRNLAIQESSIVIEAGTMSPTPLAQASPFLVRAKWVGMWVLSTLEATFGVAITVGLLTSSTQLLTSRAMRIRLVWTPYYPVPLLVGLVVGYFSYTHFKGSYRYWAWVGPAVLTLVSLAAWKASHQFSLAEATIHFFGSIPYPGNRDQMDTSLFLYMSMAYSAGAFVQTKMESLAGSGRTLL